MSYIEPSTKTKIVKRTLKGFVYVLLFIITFIVLSISLFNIVYIETTVYGLSMQPLYNVDATAENEAGDIVFVNRFIQGNIGDIVVANVPWKSNGKDITIIKRYIAKGGDRVKFVKENEIVYLYINGEVMQEDYVSESQHAEYNNWRQFLINNDESHTFEIDEDGYLVIPKNHVYLLGDNREHSTDCSYFGPVSRDCIIGRVEYVVKKGNSIGKFIFVTIFQFLRLK